MSRLGLLGLGRRRGAGRSARPRAGEASPFRPDVGLRQGDGRRGTGSLVVVGRSPAPEGVVARRAVGGSALFLGILQDLVDGPRLVTRPLAAFLELGSVAVAAARAALLGGVVACASCSHVRTSFLCWIVQIEHYNKLIILFCQEIFL